jgi:hypothetical protein
MEDPHRRQQWAAAAASEMVISRLLLEKEPEAMEALRPQTLAP